MTSVRGLMYVIIGQPHFKIALLSSKSMLNLSGVFSYYPFFTHYSIIANLATRAHAEGAVASPQNKTKQNKTTRTENPKPANLK